MTNHPLLDHAAIAARIPHAGSMCLLDAVTFWDARRIVCSATSHRAADNPLRADDGSLGIAAGIEYAAQAMAVHGSLLAEEASRSAGDVGMKPPPGMLASVRAVEMHAGRLDDLASALQVEATQIASDARALVYAIEIFVFGPIDELPTRAESPWFGDPPEERQRGAAHRDDLREQDGQTATRNARESGNRVMNPPAQPRRSVMLRGRASVMLLPDTH